MLLKTPLSSPLILMADDSRDDCRLVEMALKRLNFKCNLSTVGDGVALLERLKTGDLPSLILLDLNMPIKNGFETLKEIKATPFWRSIPIVIWSTSHSPMDIQETYAIGTNAFMSKPDSFSGIVRSMQSLVDFWFESTQLPHLQTDNPNQ